MHWGGQEYRTVLENLWLNAHGHAAWLACHPRSATWREGRRLGARLLALPFRKRWRLDVPLRLLALCWRHGVDVIHCHGSRDSALAGLAHTCGIPVVRSRHVSGPVRSPYSYMRHASHVIASAEVVRARLVASGVAPAHVSVIGEGVDLGAFRPGLGGAALRSELGLAADAQVVLNVGMLRRDKGQATLLEALGLLRRELPRLCVLVAGAPAGDTAIEPELRSRADALGLGDRFRLLGYRDDVPALMGVADVVAVTSTATEAQSRVVPQAFACGTPVVTSRLEGLQELVRDGETGLLFPPGDAVALAAALQRLLSDEPLRQALSAAGLDRARRTLAMDRAMAETLAVYRRVSTRR